MNIKSAYYITLANIHDSLDEFLELLPFITVNTIEDEDFLTIDVKSPSTLGYLHYEFCFNIKREVVTRALYIERLNDDFVRTELTLEAYCDLPYEAGHKALAGILSMYRRCNDLSNTAEHYMGV